MMLQVAVIGAICPLCTASAAIAMLLCVIASFDFPEVPPGRCHHAAAHCVIILGSLAVLVVGQTLDRKAIHFGIPNDLSLAQTDGSPNAPVKLIVFSDFDCGHCADFAPTLRRIRETFPEEVVLGIRWFPRENRPQAWAAAAAAECAGIQGKFGSFHDSLFAKRGALADGDFVAAAQAAGLNQNAFTQCLASNEGMASVEASYRDAVRLGIQGTPSVFLNGRWIGGAISYEKLAALIRAELAAKRPDAH